MKRRLVLLALLPLAVTASACGGENPGSVSVVLEAEDTITEGIAAGSAEEDIADGWQVDYAQFVVAVGNVETALVGSDEHAHDETVYAVDLTQLPATGLPLWSIDDVTAGDWDVFYSIGDAASAVRHSSVDQGVLDDMVAGDLTYSIAGTLSQTGGQSCPPAALANPGAAVPNGNTNSAGDDCYDNPSIEFGFDVQTPTLFGPCEVDGIPGFTVPAGGTVTIAFTIHGDHVFFNGFPEGGEGGVTRLAQWLADCDLDVDGVVTMDELAAIAPSDLAEIDNRYQLGGSPLTPLDSMLTYVEAQLKTQGHFQGEGECPVDGVLH